MSTPASIVGYVAAIVGTFMMLPQVIKSWRTKRVADLSAGMVVIYFVNCGLWLTYGALTSDQPIILANGVGLVIGFFQLVIKMRYRSIKTAAAQQGG